jgi:type III pantothenate kinase
MVINDSLYLMIGNSRLHFCLYSGENLKQSWDRKHFTESENAHDYLSSILPNFAQIPLYLASVVSEQTRFWQNHPHQKIITLIDLPLGGIYATLGIDRGLALVGAGENYGYPVLVIDAGTALTFTGANSEKILIGGAILPGLGLQFKSLARHTSALPQVIIDHSIPPRFANNTETAIASGIIYTLIAGIVDFIETWWLDYPESKIILTGGDRDLIYEHLKNRKTAIATKIIVDQNLIFKGMKIIPIKINQNQ